MLDAYLENLNEEEREDFAKALSIYYENKYCGVNLNFAQGEDLDVPEELMWHLYTLMLIDRVSGSYARFEYQEHF